MDAGVAAAFSSISISISHPSLSLSLRNRLIRHSQSGLFPSFSMIFLLVIALLAATASSAILPKRTMEGRHHRSRAEREAGTCGATPVEPPYPPVSSCGKHTRIRRDVKSLTGDQKAGFVTALHALKAMVSPWNNSFTWYDQFVHFHQQAVQQSRIVGHGIAHQNAAFPPWHRKLLWLLEYAMCEATGLAIGLPYWDWTNPASTSAIFRDDLMGKCGVAENNYAVISGPFRRGVWQLNLAPTPGCAFQQSPWNYLVRGCGAAEASNYPVALPTAVQVSDLLRIDNYDSFPYNMSALNSFRNTLEGFVPPKLDRQMMHNIVHDWIAGQFFMRNGTGSDAGGQFALFEKIGDVSCDSRRRNSVGDHIYCGTGGRWVAREGAMEPLDVSPNDPSFFLHHTNVDRIWYLWQENNHQGPDFYSPHSGAPEGWNLPDQMFPYNNTELVANFPAIFSENRVEQQLDSQALGVIYQ